jgi:hypothetical protein
MGTLRRFSTVAIALLLVTGVTACGGDDSGDDASSDAGSTEGASDTTADDDTSDDEMDDESSDDDSGSSGGAVGATVTIGDETFEAANELVCIGMGGALSANFQDDSGDVTVYIDLPPPDWETDTQSDWPPPSVRVDDDREDPISQWVSGDDTLANAPETSVDDYQIDGKQATGSGTFVDIYPILSGGDGEVVDGTFQFSCE